MHDAAWGIFSRKFSRFSRYWVATNVAWGDFFSRKFSRFSKYVSIYTVAWGKFLENESRNTFNQVSRLYPSKK
jgi:hypothetical protein